MIVYRLAHKQVVDPRTGKPAGPYGTAAFEDAWQDQRDRFRRFLYVQDKLCDLSLGPTHLTPFADPELRFIYPNEICGFSSLEFLRQWFRGCLTDLRDVGFEVQEYDVPDKYVRTGYYGQVLFDCKQAKRTREDA